MGNRLCGVAYSELYQLCMRILLNVFSLPNQNLSKKIRTCQEKKNKIKPQQKRTRLDRSSPMRADLREKITISQALHVDISGDFCAMTCDWSRKYVLDTRNYYKTSMPSIHSNDHVRLHI